MSTDIRKSSMTTGLRTSPKKASRPVRAAAAAFAAAALVGTTTLLSPTGAVAASAGPTEHTDMGVTGADAFAHLSEISRISEENAATGYRSLGSPGYEAAGQYVEQVLEATGAFDVSRQTFEVEDQTFENVGLTVAGVELTEDVIPLSYTEGYDDAAGSGEVPVVLPGGDGAAAALGCTAADYTDDADGALVVVQRGTCSFSAKVTEASNAGAAGVIVYNNAAGPLNGTLGARTQTNAPGVGITQADGEAIVAAIEASAETPSPSPTATPTDDPSAPAAEPVTGTLTLQTEFTTVDTFNIIADTKAGDPENVIAMGAHLDGVAEGPGVNDNGSGVAGVLALAEAIAEQPTENDKKIRLGFWGAEEVGLLGSDYYVNDLAQNDPDELKRIKAYLNYDMIGSDNYTLATYDADGSYVPIPDGVTVPEGSVDLEEIYEDYYAEQDQPVVGTDFDGRSDYQAFMDNGVPVGGLFSGADAVKTAEEAELFGGTAGQPLDTNYHQASDTLANVSQESLDLFLPGMGWAAHVLAWDLVDEEPEPTDSPEPTDEPAPSDEPSPSESPAPANPGGNDDGNGNDDGGSDDDNAGGELPRTGVDAMPLVAAALALVLLGLILAGVTRRKRLE